MEIDARFFLNGQILHPHHARPAPGLDAEADGKQEGKGGEKLWRSNRSFPALWEEEKTHWLCEYSKKKGSLNVFKKPHCTRAHIKPFEKGPAIGVWARVEISLY